MRTFLIAIGVLAAVAIGHAQIRRPKADVTPIVESDGVHAGTDVRVALRLAWIVSSLRWISGSENAMRSFTTPTIT